MAGSAGGTLRSRPKGEGEPGGSDWWLALVVEGVRRGEGYASGVSAIHGMH